MKFTMEIEAPHLTPHVLTLALRSVAMMIKSRPFFYSETREVIDGRHNVIGSFTIVPDRGKSGNSA